MIGRLQHNGSASARRNQRYLSTTRFTPDRLRLLVKFACQRINLGVEVHDLQHELDEFAVLEEDLMYGV